MLEDALRDKDQVVAVLNDLPHGRAIISACSRVTRRLDFVIQVTDTLHTCAEDLITFAALAVAVGALPTCLTWRRSQMWQQAKNGFGVGSAKPSGALAEFW